MTALPPCTTRLTLLVRKWDGKLVPTVGAEGAGVEEFRVALRSLLSEAARKGYTVEDLFRTGGRAATEVA